MLHSKLSIGETRKLILAKLQKHGVSRNDADAIVVHLIDAEARGYPGHGLRRLPAIIKASEKANLAPKRRANIDKAGFIALDGARGLGIPSVSELLELAKKRANKSGAVFASLTNYVGTTGSLGVYGARLANEGYVSIMFCSSEFAVAPYGSRRAILGTNPIAISVPTSEFSFVADVATAAWSYGSLREAMLANRKIPEGIVQSADGAPSTDPHDADNGSQLPMAGHKGYALGLGIELLCGPLIGGKAGRDAVQGSDGFVAIVAKVDVARSASEVKRDELKLFEEIRSAPAAQGSSGARIPGEASARKQREAAAFDIPDDLLQQINAL